VIEDNATGKVRAYYDTWTHECSLTSWANTPGGGRPGPGLVDVAQDRDR
jgi:hypothetical protein